MNLANTLMRRTAIACTFALQRTDHVHNSSSPWWAFSLTDWLGGYLIDDTTIEYKRPHHKTGRILLKNLQMTATDEAKFGPTVVISEDVGERAESRINVASGATYDEVVEHTFSRTTSLKESMEVGAKVAVEAEFGYAAGTAGGFYGGAKFSAEISAKYGRDWGSSDTHTDTVKRNIHITGPFHGKYIAERSLAKVSRTAEVTPKFEHQIEIYDNETLLYSWNSLEELMMVLRGEAPLDRDLADKFVDNPLSHNEIVAVAPERDMQPLRWTAIFDNVNYQKIDVLRD